MTVRSDAVVTYRSVQQDGDGATRLFMVVADEGWRQSILCQDMYAEDADWLVAVLTKHGKPPRTAVEVGGDVLFWEHRTSIEEGEHGAS